MIRKVAPGLLEVLLQRNSAGKKMPGLVCPKNPCTHDAPDTIQYAGFTAINPVTGRAGKGKRSTRKKDQGQFTKRQEITQLAHGGAMFIPKAVVKQYRHEWPNSIFFTTEEWIL